LATVFVTPDAFVCATLTVAIIVAVPAGTDDRAPDWPAGSPAAGALNAVRAAAVTVAAELVFTFAICAAAALFVSAILVCSAPVVSASQRFSAAGMLLAETELRSASPRVPAARAASRTWPGDEAGRADAAAYCVPAQAANPAVTRTAPHPAAQPRCAGRFFPLER
jgi:hypothetical protein